mgnify:CR=1 FL=1
MDGKNVKDWAIRKKAATSRYARDMWNLHRLYGDGFEYLEQRYYDGLRYSRALHESVKK